MPELLQLTILGIVDITKPEFEDIDKLDEDELYRIVAERDVSWYLCLKVYVNIYLFEQYASLILVKHNLLRTMLSCRTLYE